MKKIVASIFVLLFSYSIVMASAPPRWQSEVIALVSQQKFKEAGDKIKEYCVEKKIGDLCLTLASAYFEGEAKLGVDKRDIIEAYRYTKLACDNGSKAGCEAYKAAINKGELLQYVLFEPGVKDREAQLKEAIELGADLNSTTLFTSTLLQKAIGEEKIEVVQLLLKNGVDVNYRVSEEDLTPLMYAINNGNKEMVSLLLKHGADPNKTMKVAEYLNMGKKEANACDFAKKLEKQEMMTVLKCPDSTVMAK